MMAGCHTQIDKPNEDGNGEVTSVTILALGENLFDCLCRLAFFINLGYLPHP